MLVNVPPLDYIVDSVNNFISNFYADNGLHVEYDEMVKKDEIVDTPYITVEEKYLVKLKSDHSSVRMIVRFLLCDEMESLDVSSLTQMNKDLFCLETSLFKERLKADTETTFIFSDGVVNIVITRESHKLECIHFLFDWD
jgi:hypothetical protein